MSVTTRVRIAAFCLVAVLGPGSSIAGEAVQATVVSDTGDRIVLQYTFGQYQSEVVNIEGQKYLEISFPSEPVLLQKGSPALPHVNRSIIIPDNVRIGLRVLSSESYETQAAIAPSKGNLYRTVDPRKVAYDFGEIYGIDTLYPERIATLGSPYILRDHRGITVQVNPFQYNPVTGLLRVYTEIVLEVRAVGPGEVNVLDRQREATRPSVAFQDIYGSHFLNFSGSDRYAPLNEIGDLLVICHDDWISNMAPFVAHKNSIGINTTIVGVSTIGNSYPSILAHIQGVYDTSNLAFVLLVGDIAQIESPTIWGGASDPAYSKLAGDDDYPDIVVGRFSAGSPADVDTQVERTIEYEMLPANEQDWWWKGLGLASTEGTGDDGQYDDEHMAEIRDWLLAYGYTHVDEFYGGGATSSQVSAALNEGRGIWNYCGHGSPSGFVTSGFNSTDADNLVNENMLPFVNSVACNTGEFENYESVFAETLMRATNNGEPTGAIAVYASSISQSWAPPMEAEDEINLLLTDPTDPYFGYGAMAYAGSCSMMDDYGADGVEMFDTWILFGDPSLRIKGRACSDAGVVNLDRDLYACEDSVNISVLDCNLNTDDQVVEIVVVEIDSDSESGIETVTLVEANENSANFQGSIALSEIDGSGVLFVTGDDTITVTYVDPDDGEGGTNVTVTDQATVDCTAPEISNVQSSDVTGSRATITWETDEPSDSLVTYGIALPDLSEGVDGLVATHFVELMGLNECSTYLYSVTSVDEVDNTATHDNAGVYHTFETGKNVNPTYTTLEPPVSIPDNDPAGAEMSIFVTDEKPIVDVDVEIHVTHTYTGDLEVSLIGPGGTEVTLSNRRGGSGNNSHGTIFDDEASTAIGSGSAPFTGSYSPDGLLSIFDDTMAAGEWRLRVEDHAGSDLGTIDTWSLLLTYPVSACGPHMEHESYTLADSCAGFGGSGGNNGTVDPGEDTLLDVVLHNDGTADMTGVVARLTSNTPGVTITQPVSQYPDLATGETADNVLNPFAFTVDASVLCGIPIDFELDISANEGEWVDPISIAVGGTLGGSLCNNCSVQLPGAVLNLGWGGTTSLEWGAVSGAKFYRLFRGDWVDLPNLMDQTEDSCERLTTAALESGDVLDEEPAADSSFWYVICAGNGGGDGPVGNASAGPRIVNADGVCP